MNVPRMSATLYENVTQLGQCMVEVVQTLSQDEPWL